MIDTVITLGDLDISEGLRYLGYKGAEPDATVMTVVHEAEQEVLRCAKPRYTYRVFDIVETEEGILAEGTGFTLLGNSIRKHLKNCKRAVYFAATISADIDKMLRIAQVNDLSKAIIMDSLASVAIEQVCDKFEQELKKEFAGLYQTFRFGLGYGDLPITQQKEFVKLLNAQKLIGLSVSDSYMMIPTKSVTAIIGLSEEPVKGAARGCQTCNMQGRCQFRAKGGHCNG